VLPYCRLAVRVVPILIQLRDEFVLGASFFSFPLIGHFFLDKVLFFDMICPSSVNKGKTGKEVMV
jgi:hypothetical protein